MVVLHFFHALITSVHKAVLIGGGDGNKDRNKLRTFQDCMIDAVNIEPSPGIIVFLRNRLFLGVKLNLTRKFHSSIPVIFFDFIFSSY